MIVALWDGAAAQLRELVGDQSKIRVIPNGTPADRVDTSSEVRVRERARLGLEDGTPLVAYIGSLTREKNPAAAVRATAAVPGAHLVVAGSGPQRSSLEQLAAESAPGRVVFTGTTEAPGALLAAADALILPSQTEGLPGVAIEAGLAGKPVVATDVGGVREIVVDGETGRVVPPDDETSLTAALDDVLRNGETLGAAGRDRCLARFEISVVADAWDDLLAELGAWS